MSEDEIPVNLARSYKLLEESRDLLEKPGATPEHLKAQITFLCGHLNSCLSSLRIVELIVWGAHHWQDIPEGDPLHRRLKWLRKAYEAEQARKIEPTDS